MTFGDLVAVAAGAIVTGLLLWFFFGTKRSQRAELQSAMQLLNVTIRGGYSPDVIRARRGVLLRLVFDRKESAAMALSSLSVVTDANRLRRWRARPLPTHLEPAAAEPVVEVPAVDTAHGAPVAAAAG